MFERVLIANRGEVAKRIARTCFQMGITPVAVFSEADADSSWIRYIPESIAIAGHAPADSYLRASAIIDAAKQANVDAIHPGYGFLSESAQFAQACRDAGFAFVGPEANTIALMGNKIEAKQVMADARIPVLGDRPFPVMVKAAAGGGGTGMVSVTDEAELEAALVGAARTAEAAFGDGTVFVERQLEAPRHIEVQVVCDNHGTIATLFERDCSVQRRYQKLIEESPAPGVSTDMRGSLFAAAETACRATNYRGVGTVEFLVEGDSFFFLEMNTRLQVEHAVTELVTGIDLVRCQLEIAAGQALPGEVVKAQMNGHAIEARLYAEDPNTDFLPSTGRIELFDVNADQVDATYESGDTITEFYDPLIAKIIATGSTRSEAIAKLVRSLRTARIHGIPTNRDLLVGLLGHDSFVTGTHTTALLTDSAPSSFTQAASEPDRERMHAVLVAMVHHHQRLSTSPARPFTMELAGNVDTYTITTEYTGNHFAVDINGEQLPGLVHSSVGDAADVQVGNRRYNAQVSRSGAAWYVDSEAGPSQLTVARNKAAPQVQDGRVTAPIAGKVVALGVSVGSRVQAGDRLLTIEIMKMERSIPAPADGSIDALVVSVGAKVQVGDLLAVIGLS